MQKHQSGPLQGQFNLKGSKELLRSRVVVAQDYIDEQNEQSFSSGILYEVDEAATTERDKELDKKHGRGAAKEANKNEEQFEESEAEKADREDREQNTNLKFAIAEKINIEDPETTHDKLKAFAKKHDIVLSNGLKAQTVGEIKNWLALPIEPKE